MATLPLITRQRVIAAKVEGVAGTPEALTATEGQFNVFDPALVPNIEMNQREGQSSLSMLPSVTSRRGSEITFENELHGSNSVGVQPDWADVFLLACGFKKAVGVYTPETGSPTAKTLTIGMFEDGRFRSMAGAMGNLVMRFRSGDPVRLAWTFGGVWELPVDAALIAPTFPTVLPPRFASATMTIEGRTYKISNLEINLNNEMTLREDPTTASGLCTAVIVNRRVTFTVDPEAELLAAQDWFDEWITHKEVALQIIVGSAADNTMQIDIPKAQVMNVQPGDREGTMVDALEFQANRDTSAGDDEIVITFT